MINETNRNHWIYVIQNIISAIKNMFFIFLLLIVKKNNIYYIAGIILLIIIFSIIEWRKTIFYINDDLLVYEKGVLSKSKEEIPFNKINTIDVGQTLLDRVFKVCTVKIDTGSAIAAKSEFKIITGYDIAEELRRLILNSNKDEETELNCEVEDNKESIIAKKVITNREIFKYALTKSKLGWAIGGFFILNNKLDDIGRFFNLSFSKVIEKYMDVDSIKVKSIGSTIIVLVAFALMIYILITILSIIFEAIRLYKFTVKADNEKISISYGLLSKKEYSFNIDKIYGIRYKQSIIQQLIKTYTVELITVGYGDEKNESALLYPIGDNKFKDEFIKRLLPSMSFDGEIKRPPKSSLRRFILKKLTIWLMILIPMVILVKIVPMDIRVLIVSIILISSLIRGCLSYKNTSLGVTTSTLIASSGAFSKVTTIVGQDNLQSITKKQGIFQKRGKVCNYKIDIYSNKLSDIVEVKHMGEELYEELNNNLEL